MGSVMDNRVTTEPGFMYRPECIGLSVTMRPPLENIVHTSFPIALNIRSAAVSSNETEGGFG
jgi:hypothetical protein